MVLESARETLKNELATYLRVDAVDEFYRKDGRMFARCDGNFHVDVTDVLDNELFWV